MNGGEAMRSTRLVVDLILALVATVAFAAPAIAQDTISFTGKDDVTPSVKGGTGSITVAVVNGGPETAITWSVKLKDGPNGTLRTADIDPPTSMLPARSTTLIVLTLKDVSTTGKLSGVLIGLPTGTGTPITRTLTISNFGISFSIDPGWLIGVVLALAGLLLLLRYALINKSTYDKPITKRSWSFTTSWSATFTGVGALLATLVSAGALPDEPYLLDKATFAGLAITFGALGLLAPIVFLALNGRVNSLRVFHLATWLATAAVIGQLTTIVFLLVDAFGQESSSWFVIGLGLLELVGLILVSIYVYRGVPEALKDALKPDSESLVEHGSSRMTFL
jgi:hypothetical protein